MIRKVLPLPDFRWLAWPPLSFLLLLVGLPLSRLLYEGGLAFSPALLSDAYLQWRLGWSLLQAGATCALTLLLGLLWCGYGFVVHPLLDEENSARGIMRQARALAGDGTVIGLVDWKEQNLLQAVGPVTEFGFRAPPATQLERGRTWLGSDPSGRRLLVQRSPALACVDFEADGQRIGSANRREWWLVGPGALANCPPATP